LAGGGADRSFDARNRKRASLSNGVEKLACGFARPTRRGRRQSSRRPAKVLIRQNHFVKIAGDRDFVVLEVLQPSAAAFDRVGQQMQNIAQRDGNRLSCDARLAERGGFVLRTVIHAQISLSHERRILTSGQGWGGSAAHFVRVRAASCGILPHTLLPPHATGTRVVIDRKCHEGLNYFDELVDFSVHAMLANARRILDRKT